MASPAVPAMPTRLYSSVAKTFSMSRLAMMLPIVARRSPAMTTPPSKVSVTIVVPCGASRAAPGWQRAPRGQQRRRVRGEELGERGRPRDEVGRGQASGVGSRGHWPPFWTNPRTNSSALDSSTPSISSRMSSISLTWAAGAAAAGSGVVDVVRLVVAALRLDLLLTGHGHPPRVVVVLRA